MSPKDLLFGILELLGAQCLGTWGASKTLYQLISLNYFS